MRILKYLVVLALMILGMYWMLQARKSTPVTSDATRVLAPDVSNLDYTIKDETFSLVDGRAEKDLPPGMPAKNKLMLFGEPTYADLDGDLDTDAAVWIVNNPGATGRFFYAAFVINNGDGSYHSTNAMFLGDRIAPQSITIDNGRAVYNFAERKPGEAMTVKPSVGKSIYVHYNSQLGDIGEWVKDFEGESNIPK